MQTFHELSDVLLAVSFSVWLVKKLQHANKNVQTLFDNVLLNDWVEEELFENLDCSQAELAVAKSYQKEIFHFAQDSQPIFQVLVSEVKLGACIKDFDMWPLKEFKRRIMLTYQPL